MRAFVVALLAASANAAATWDSSAAAVTAAKDAGAAVVTIGGTGHVSDAVHDEQFPNYWGGPHGYNLKNFTGYPLTVTAGTVLKFIYWEHHNVVEVPSLKAFEDCDFSEYKMMMTWPATWDCADPPCEDKNVDPDQWSGHQHTHSSPDKTWKYEGEVVVGGEGVMYLACAMRNITSDNDPSAFWPHCKNSGQKLQVTVVPAEEDPPPSESEEDPCFPSSAMVTLADGTPRRIDTLKEGDEIVSATANGALTTDTVSLLSIAKPEAQATFVTFATDAGKTLTLTPEHHLPVGEACCSTLKKAKEVVEGETVWTTGGAARVIKKGAAIEKGLHSPVLTHGSFPVVDEVVTSFDSIFGVKLAKYGLKYAIPLCKATGSCSLFRAIVGAERAYIAPSGASAAAFAALAAVAK